MTTKRNLLVTMIALTTVSSLALMPVSAVAQSKKDLKHRQEQKNTWRNLAIGSGVVGLYGLIKHDNTLAILGLGGALYSADRYEKDRKSQKNMERERAKIIHRGYYYKSGHRYDRKTVYKNGHKYYTFVKHR